jgi:hypothetical protein
MAADGQVSRKPHPSVRCRPAETSHFRAIVPLDDYTLRMMPGQSLLKLSLFCAAN